MYYIIDILIAIIFFYLLCGSSKEHDDYDDRVVTMDHDGKIHDSVDE